MKKNILIILSMLVILLCSFLIIFINKEEKTYQVTFKIDSTETYMTLNVKEGEQVNRPENPVKENYDFICWMLGEKEYDFNTIIKNDMEIIANFKEKQLQDDYIIVSFNTDNGTTIDKQTVKKGDTIIQPSLPSKNGYKFIEWQFNNKKWDFNTKINENITLVAKWEKVVSSITSTYTVKFDSAGGSKIENQIVEKNKTASIPNNPIRDGYIFDGWYLNNNLYDFNTTIKENILLTAKWTKKEVKTFTIKFDTKSGNTINSLTIKEGEKISKPANPVREGYEFSNWTLNGKVFDFNTPIVSDITLVANYIQKSYTIVATPVDTYSPDVILTVKENNLKVSFNAIKYADGTLLCNGSNPTVNKNDIIGENEFIVVLNSNVVVRAKLN